MQNNYLSRTNVLASVLAMGAAMGIDQVVPSRHTPFTFDKPRRKDKGKGQPCPKGKGKRARAKARRSNGK